MKREEEEEEARTDKGHNDVGKQLQRDLQSGILGRIGGRGG